MPKQWFVLRVKSTIKRIKSSKCLIGQLSLGAKRSYECFGSPSEKSIRNKKVGKKDNRRKKIYPGYIIYGSKLMNAGRYLGRFWFLIRETPFVGDFIRWSKQTCTNGKASQVENYYLRRAQRRKASCKNRDFVRVKKSEVQDGPFENYDGTVEEVLPCEWPCKSNVNGIWSGNSS